MPRKVVITCAVNGGADPKANPAIPITPEQIARASIDAARAGAAMIHLHVAIRSAASDAWTWSSTGKRCSVSVTAAATRS
jgi:uncharacterized protein (DUF849 family)